MLTGVPFVALQMTLFQVGLPVLLLLLLLLLLAATVFTAAACRSLCRRSAHCCRATPTARGRCCGCCRRVRVRG
jgi:hypothetical protein